MHFKSIHTPNFSKRSRNSKKIKFLIIHYTGMQSKRVSLKRLQNPRYKVSCHFLVDRRGEVVKLVDEKKTAWHAGKSKWKSFVNLNKNSIGIELVNKGHKYGYEKFSKKQINSLVRLCVYLKKKYHIKKQNILGHSDIAPLRKSDPGEKFPWETLEQKDLGILPNKKIKINLKDKNLRDVFFKNLTKIGYRYFNSKSKNLKNRLVIKSFQRHFRQRKINGIIDLECAKLSSILVKKT